LTDF